MFIRSSPELNNPIWQAMKDAHQQFKNLNIDRAGIISATLSVCALVVAWIILFCLLPYGWILMLEYLLRELMMETFRATKAKTMFELLPYAILCIVYSLIWIPFVIPSLPALALGGWFRHIHGSQNNV